MKTRSTITKLITITMAVAAMAVVGSIWTTQAQEVRVFRGTALAAFIPGQSLHFSLANMSTREEGGEPIRAQAYIYDSRGNILSQTDPVEVPAGQSHTFIVNRDNLAVAGEEGTGRLQVRAVIQVAIMDGSVSPINLPVSMELVDNGTGGTISSWQGSLGLADWWRSAPLNPAPAPK